MKHITVLHNEALNGLAINPDSVVVDATLGAAGHASAIISKLSSKGVFIGIDADSKAIEYAQTVLGGEAHIELVNSNFVELATILDNLNIESVDAILADLGWRTDQFLESGRGFSFNDETALLMTYGDPTQYSFTAHDIINDWEEEVLANIIFGYGEERLARKIARAVVVERAKTPIVTAKQLADIVATAVGKSGKYKKTHPATKTFQAVRIAVNDELRVLERFILAAWHRLAPRGRLAIITFHSLEDRLVKHTFRSFTHDQVGMLVTKKPIIPTSAECQSNPRARSAKLRIISKL